MITFIKQCALYLSVLCLSACAAASIQSQVAPSASITKNDALFLTEESNSSISHQKYYAALKDVMAAQGFNLVHAKSQAKYIMKVTFDDFQADIYQQAPNAETTISNGNIGGLPVRSQSTTIRNETVHRQIPTHNSTISVSDKKTGQQVWQVSIAKSYDVYNHTALKQMIGAMLSLYGRDDKATEIVSDGLRW